MCRLPQAPCPESIPAIPTEYGGVNFRSRLEARWAAFFDLVQWEWHYEPVDFRGLIPDFVLLFDDARPIYVEVKPVWRFPVDVAAELALTGCDEPILIVGAGNPIRVRSGCGPGWVRDAWRWTPTTYVIVNGRLRIDPIAAGGDPETLDQTVTAKWREAGNLTQWGRATHRLKHISEIEGVFGGVDSL